MENDDLYFTISTAGHVDHGKTSVLKTLTGMDPDRLKEEKQRQMTTDLGFVHLRLSAPPSFGGNAAFNVGFIDVPGHGKFLKNMIAGVGALDMALLVVAADEGPMPQTLQHMEILSLLDVKKILLVVTKVDLVNEEKVQSTIIAVSDLCHGYELEIIESVAVSNQLGTGFDELKNVLVRCLCHLASRSASSLRQMPVRLPIDRAFSITGHGLVTTGTLVSGQVCQGDTLWVEPSETRARVRSLETFGQAIELANPGQRLALNLSVKDHAKLVRGQTLVSAPFPGIKTILVDLEYFVEAPIKDRNVEIRAQPVRFYHGTAEIAGRLNYIDAWPERTSAQGNLTSGQSQAQQNKHKRSFLSQITLDEPLIAEPGDRFILRYGDEGLAGGTILLKSRPRWLTREASSEFCQLLLAKVWDAALVWFAERSPLKMLKKSNVELFIPLTVRDGLIGAVVTQQKLSQIGDFLLTQEYLDFAEEQILAKLSALESTDAASGKRAGIPLEHLRASLSPPPDRTIYDASVESLCHKNQIVKEGEKLFSRQASDKIHDLKINPAHVAQVEKALGKVICLEVDALSSSCKLSAKELGLVLDYLEHEGKVARVAHDFVSSIEAINQAHKALAEIWTDKGQIAPTDFKERLNITRKYAMALLSYFDDILITRRLADRRVLLKKP